MFGHKFNEQVPFHTYLEWSLLIFLAGHINVGGYLACHRFVSHVTGFSTLAGVEFSEGKPFDAFAVLTIPIFFLMGVMISAYLTEKKFAHKDQGHRYAPVMSIVGCIMLFVGLMGHFNFFGQFGDPANLKVDYFLLALLCGACGLQNAAITSASGSTVRTTHLTGLTTDLGLGLVKAETHKLSLEERHIERRANALRIMSIVAFTFGSFVGAIVFVQFRYLGFLFPSAIAFLAAYLTYRKSKSALPY